MAAVILDAQPRSEPHPKRRRIRSPYPVAWSLHPGDPGFARYVEGLIQAAGLPALLRCSSPADDLPRDQWYQTILRWLVHPYTPVRRLLVAWQLGSGKTIGMIIALSNYYEDPRPKVVVVPTEDLVTNFYRALLATDNPYRRWLHSVDPTLGPNSVGRAQQLLERASGGSGTPAPLRAFRYTLAGGRTLLRSPLMAFGPSHWREARRKNPLSHTVVVCDEAHNIVQPPDDIFNKLQVKNVHRFGRRLENAEMAVVVLFTATPVVVDATDAENLLRIVKGRELATKGDEGFVSCPGRGGEPPNPESGSWTVRPPCSPPPTSGARTVCPSSGTLT